MSSTINDYYTDNHANNYTNPIILNDDVISVIKDFLPAEKRVWLTKEDYIKYHPIIKTLIPDDYYDTYIHEMIKHDYSFVFTQILAEQFDKFHNWKQFEKNGNIYHSYLIYLRDFCLKKNAIKCANVIDNIASKKGFSSNWFKRRGIIISNLDITDLLSN